MLRLSATDGASTVSDDVTVEVSEDSGGTITTIEKRVSAGSDDAEQAVSGSNSLTSSDLELTTDKTREQVIGMRFVGHDSPDRSDDHERLRAVPGRRGLDRGSRP